MKICSLCKYENKEDAKTCLHCSHPLNKVAVVSKIADKKVVTGSEKGPAKPPPLKLKEEGKRRNLKYNILIPAGSPPCKPASNATDDQIIEWIYEIVNKGAEEDKNYTATAIKYFARTFWQSKQFDHVCEIVDELFPGSN